MSRRSDEVYETPPGPGKERREFYWSARTLRCEVFDDEDFLVRLEDCLGVDGLRCVVAYEPYGELIVKLLNEHFAKGALEPTKA